MDIAKFIKPLLYTIVVLSVLFPAAAYMGVFFTLILFIYTDKFNETILIFKKQVPIAILLIGLLVSTILSKEPIFSIAADFLIILHLLLFLFIIVEIGTDNYKAMFNIMSVTCLAVCLFGLYQFFFGDFSGIKSWVDQKSFGVLERIYSTMQNPNVFAGYIVINLCFFISKYLVDKSKRSLFLIINIALLSVCLILTYSRGGFISFCISMGVLFLFKRDKALILYVAVMILSFYLYNSLGSVNRAGLEEMAKDSSNTYRIEIWKAAWRIFVENPVSGHGVGTLWYFLSSKSVKLYRYVLHAHNIYLHIAAEMGIIGLVSFLYFVLSEMFNALQLWLKYRLSEERYIYLGFISSSIAILAHGMFDAVIFIPSLSIIFISYYSLYKLASYINTKAEVNYGFIISNLNKKHRYLNTN